MTKLPNGSYRTEAGSLLEVSGKHGGIFALEFDWFEENACCDCNASAAPELYGDEWVIVWDCETCGGGEAKLFADVPSDCKVTT
jgi:hypothetical protein